MGYGLMCWVGFVCLFVGAVCGVLVGLLAGGKQ